MDERRIHELEARVAALERAVADMRRGAAPNPVRVPPHIQPPPIVFSTPPAAAAQVAAAPPPAAPPAEKPDTEYLIGAKVIPIVAALILLLGIGYLVSLGLTKGWITPAMLFAGACALCAAFVGVGQIKREEKEEFGQILTGIGSCGFYLTFAAGHIYQKLYSGETLVGLFLALSFLNLGYSLWRESRAFLGIGMIGGLAAALMPMQRENIPLNVGLHFLVLLPCALVAARRRWAEMSALLWGAATLALMPAWSTHYDWRVRIGALCLSTLICVGSYEFGRQGSGDAFRDGFGPFAIGLTALLNMLMHSGKEGSLHVALFALAAAGLGYALGPQRPARRLLPATALAVTMILVPWGFPVVTACYLFAGLAVASGLVAAYAGWPSLALLAGVELALGVTAYFQLLATRIVPGRGLDPWTETAILAALAAAAVAAAFGSIRSKGPAQPLVILAAVVVMPMFLKVSLLWLGSSGAGLDPFFAAAIGIALFSMVALALNTLTSWNSAADFLWAVILLGLVVYTVAVVDGPRGVLDVFVVTVYGLMVASACAATVRTGGNRRSAVTAAGFIVGALLARVSFLLLGSAGLGWHPSIAIAAGTCAYAVTAGAATMRLGWKELLPVTGAFWAASGLAFIAYVDAAGHSGPLGQVLMCLALLGSLVFVTLLFTIESDDKRVPLTVGSMAGWVVFSRLGYLMLGPVGLGMQEQASISVAWTIFGFAILAVGFLVHRSALRYCSFVVLGSTVGKVLLIDLAGTDPAIRVVVLMALGTALLGGGYWYIRSRQALAP